ncbi:peptidylprolyl isomerase [Alkalitalea saponilacus]|uniref:Periplasmic chaperone PpiD n=1 Tax=Alkalitalea saponilacus TaxID=889453 RepID=A0A1T5HR40_9BACT|nr:peptidylprolyl isomerase [Alkalitalea saponilacus]ASB48389.1 peptidylprolyl isomerase [Alkalitalea saponilacus]SKC23139.1 peptidyl-prolyl cis-trans isomerase D [Alkalitalea saponilacus]
MATLETLRRKGGLLVAIFIGFALFAFIMMDFMGSGGSVFSGSQDEVANINGTSVSIQEFQNRVTEMEEFNKLNRGVSSLSEEEVHRLREEVWMQMINQILLEEQYEELGISVTSDELMDMVTGRNIHPAIRQHPLFANPQTGAFDQQQVINFLMMKNSDHIAYFYWMMMEEQLMNERAYNKFSTAIKRGMFVPSLWKDSEISSRSHAVDFEFVTARFTSIDDADVTVTDNEIRDFYNRNRNRFKQEASRTIEYVTFVIEPTEEDRRAAEDWINNMYDRFSAEDLDAAQFVNLNSDEPFTGRNYRASELSSRLEQFVTNASVGDVHGPYLENESYRLTRLVAVNNIPDSVRARHILIQEMTPAESHTVADSLMNLIRGGANFATLAREYSTDPGSAVNGGDLGWFREGMMVQPFNDAAFQGSTGDIVKVETQFGVHIINIQQQGRPTPKYQIATLARNINYSSRTYQDVYTRATRFAAVNNTPEKFNQAIEEEGLTKRFGRNIRENDRSVGALQNSREVVRWAYDASEGAMSPAFELGDQFVVAHLTTVNREGVRPLADVRSEIERQLRNDKKAEILKARFQEKTATGLDMVAIAEALGETVMVANGVTFGSFQVPGAGVEPALVSLAAHAPLNQISVPVRGNNGVYVVRVTNIEEREPSVENIMREINQNLTMKVDHQLIENMIDEASIVDRRLRFY